MREVVRVRIFNHMLRLSSFLHIPDAVEQQLARGDNSLIRGNQMLVSPVLHRALALRGESVVSLKIKTDPSETFRFHRFAVLLVTVSRLARQSIIRRHFGAIFTLKFRVERFCST